MTTAKMTVIESHAVRRSVRHYVSLGTVKPRVDLTVRPYTCPHTADTRWALVLDSDDLTITDFASETEAVDVYEQLARACESEAAADGGHEWTVTDVPGLPLNVLDAALPRTAPRRVVHETYPEVVVLVEIPSAPLRSGDVVDYRGSAAKAHGLAVVVGPCFCGEDECYDAGNRLEVWTPEFTLEHVHPSSVTRSTLAQDALPQAVRETVDLLMQQRATLEQARPASLLIGA